MMQSIDYQHVICGGGAVLILVTVFSDTYTTSYFDLPKQIL